MTAVTVEANMLCASAGPNNLSTSIPCAVLTKGEPLHVGRLWRLIWMGLLPVAGWATGCSPATEFKAKVVGVSDGDTITVLRGRAELRVRLDGVDCPESGQAFGKRAKAYTASRVFGKAVTIRPTLTDRYGRTVAEVKLLDGSSLNQDLVRSGLAWWFRRYAPDDPQLERLEAEAKAARRGLWTDAHPIAPWDWRKSRVASTKATEPSWARRGATLVLLLVALTVLSCRRKIASYVRSPWHEGAG
jgi:endonuclease YncB( thermonuclease family)